MLNNLKSIDNRVYVDLAQLLQLQVAGKRLSQEFFVTQNHHNYGLHNSVMRGRSVNFEELKVYSPGDDVRLIDWKATNKLNKPYVRSYLKESQRSVSFIVDQSGSMFFGSQERMKSVTATQVAALLAWCHYFQNDQVGAHIFNDEEQQHLTPNQSEFNIHNLLTKLAEFNHRLEIKNAVNCEQTNLLNKSLDTCLKMAKKESLIYIISDMVNVNEETLDMMNSLNKDNDLININIYDPLEKQLPTAGKLTFSNGTTQIDIDTSDKNLRKAHQSKFETQLAFIKEKTIRQHSNKTHKDKNTNTASLLMVDTIQTVESQLLSYLGQ